MVVEYWEAFEHLKRKRHKELNKKENSNRFLLGFAAKNAAGGGGGGNLIPKNNSIHN
jgi:hypothetical protein